MTRAKLNGSSWIILPYFNPSNKYRLELNFLNTYNYFAKQTNNIIISEMVFNDDQRTLSDYISHQHIISRSDNIYFAKETLINIALAKLPSNCDKVVWSDADIIGPDDLIDKINSELREFKLLQPFANNQLVSLTH